MLAIKVLRGLMKTLVGSWRIGMDIRLRDRQQRGHFSMVPGAISRFTSVSSFGLTTEESHWEVTSCVWCLPKMIVVLKLPPNSA